MKLATWTSIVGVVVVGVLVLVQIWWDVFSSELFFKALLTIGVVVGVVDLSSLIREGYLRERKQRQDRSID